MTDINQLKNIIEGALLAAGRPLDVSHIADLFDEEERPERDAIREALEEVAVDCAGRGFELKKVGSGYRFQVRQELSPWVNRLWDEKPQKYSRALLETLSLIAYRQPITRGDIEEIRGVSVSSQIVKTLLEREWIRVVGHRDVPGRPSLYATTRQFLDYFNLASLEELPPLGELRDIEELDPEMELTLPVAAAEEAGADTAQPTDSPVAENAVAGPSSPEPELAPAMTDEDAEQAAMDSIAHLIQGDEDEPIESPVLADEPEVSEAADDGAQCPPVNADNQPSRLFGGVESEIETPADDAGGDNPVDAP